MSNQNVTNALTVRVISLEKMIQLQQVESYMHPHYLALLENFCATREPEVLKDWLEENAEVERLAFINAQEKLDTHKYHRNIRKYGYDATDSVDDYWRWGFNCHDIECDYISKIVPSIFRANAIYLLTNIFKSGFMQSAMFTQEVWEQHGKEIVKLVPLNCVYIEDAWRSYEAQHYHCTVGRWPKNCSWWSYEESQRIYIDELSAIQAFGRAAVNHARRLNGWEKLSGVNLANNTILVPNEHCQVIRQLARVLLAILGRRQATEDSPDETHVHRLFL